MQGEEGGVYTQPFRVQQKKRERNKTENIVKGSQKREKVVQGKKSSWR